MQNTLILINFPLMSAYKQDVVTFISKIPYLHSYMLQSG
jgi:hypothetical protein